MAPDRPPRPFFFFAARPPDNVVTSIAQAWETLGTGEPLRRDKLHVTLLPVPELPDAESPSPAVIAALTRAGSSLKLPAFDLSFDRIETWRHARGPDRPMVLTGPDVRFRNGRSEVNNLISTRIHGLDFHRGMIRHATMHRRGLSSRRHLVVRAVPPLRLSEPLRRYHASVRGRRGAATSCLVSRISRADL